MTQLLLEHISFSFGATSVITDFSLGVEKGSFTTLLGASGSGKTTLLRLIAGFLEPTAGDIQIDGKSQRKISVEERKIGMVFQDYALFPHMSVRKNILYGLSLARVPKARAEEKLHEMARTLHLEMLLSRFPHELSGGQQQRVALARSLVLEPKILLMDEPLSSLDTKLRESVREELRDIQSSVGITTIYVTHDQEEALSLSDKIAVLNDGTLVQEGSPRDIYFEPKSAFVAEFVGRANILSRGEARLMVRPEWISLVPAGNAERDAERGRIVSSSFLGGTTRFKVETERDGLVVVDARTSECADFRVGSEVALAVARTWELR